MPMPTAITKAIASRLSASLPVISDWRFEIASTALPLGTTVSMDGTALYIGLLAAIAWMVFHDVAKRAAKPHPQCP